MKPTKRDYGYTPAGKWNNEKSRYLDYLEAVKAWENRTPNPPGRKRMKLIHESWKPFLSLFDSSTPTRSQGAFCRFVGVERSMLSNALSNGMSDKWKGRIESWVKNLETEKENDNEQ